MLEWMATSWQDGALRLRGRKDKEAIPSDGRVDEKVVVVMGMDG